MLVWAAVTTRLCLVFAAVFFTLLALTSPFVVWTMGTGASESGRSFHLPAMMVAVPVVYTLIAAALVLLYRWTDRKHRRYRRMAPLSVLGWVILLIYIWIEDDDRLLFVLPNAVGAVLN